jgi:hypothetical protein
VRPANFLLLAVVALVILVGGYYLISFLSFVRQEKRKEAEKDKVISPTGFDAAGYRRWCARQGLRQTGLNEREEAQQRQRFLDSTPTQRRL